MNYDSEDELRSEGFTGFHSIGELMADYDGFEVPRDKKGIYLTLYQGKGCPLFIPPGPEICYYKYGFGQYSVEELEKERWVDGVIVINISKTNRPLYDRIDEYIRFGKGEVNNHKGGRSIWQIRGYPDLVICWKGWDLRNSSNPGDVERKMIDEFERKKGKRPFANRKRGG